MLFGVTYFNKVAKKKHSFVTLFPEERLGKTLNGALHQVNHYEGDMFCQKATISTG